MKIYRINRRTFLVSLLSVSFVIFVLFIVALADYKKQTIGVSVGFQTILSMISFPAIHVSMPVIRGGWGMPYIIFFLLFVNALLYALVVERLYTWVSVKRGRK